MRKRVVFITIKINRFLLILSISLLLSFIILPWKKEVVSTLSYYDQGTTIVIDPGHGGIDGGAGRPIGLLEKNINLDMGLTLRNMLQMDYFHVIMTRNIDISLEDKSNLNASRYKKDLDARKKIINNSNAHLFISIHANSLPQNPQIRGVKIFYHSSSHEGEKLGKEIGRSIDNILSKTNHQWIKTQVITNDFYILRETTTPGVLIEVGFLTNPMDKELLYDQRYRNNIALGIKEGIKKYLIKNQ